ncbi:MAG: peptide chain release factor N(5)-glutamine methyltransferase [Acidimicrobiia bacterium]
MTGASTLSVIGACDLPEHEAVRLLMKATGQSRTEVLFGRPVSRSEVEEFAVLVGRRLAGEPLQYLEGTVDFGPVTVGVDDRVLIPRPETEELFERAISAVSEPSVVVDLCTGSGNLAIALASVWPNARILATDISSSAVDVATSNVKANDVEAEILVGDLFAPLPVALKGRVDLIVANPPYLSRLEYDSVPRDVRAEPVGALVSGSDGDEVLARIAAEAPGWLRPDGVIMCEISEFHGQRVKGLFADLNGVIEQDVTGRDRFVVGARSVE